MSTVETTPTTEQGVSAPATSTTTEAQSAPAESSVQKPVAPEDVKPATETGEVAVAKDNTDGFAVTPTGAAPTSDGGKEPSTVEEAQIRGLKVNPDPAHYVMRGQDDY